MLDGTRLSCMRAPVGGRVEPSAAGNSAAVSADSRWVCSRGVTGGRGDEKKLSSYARGCPLSLLCTVTCRAKGEPPAAVADAAHPGTCIAEGTDMERLRVCAGRAGMAGLPPRPALGPASAVEPGAGEGTRAPGPTAFLRPLDRLSKFGRALVPPLFESSDPLPRTPLALVVLLRSLLVRLRASSSRSTTSSRSVDAWLATLEAELRAGCPDCRLA